VKPTARADARRRPPECGAHDTLAFRAFNLGRLADGSADTRAGATGSIPVPPTKNQALTELLTKKYGISTA
jgi:hypothetical protein